MPVTHIDAKSFSVYRKQTRSRLDLPSRCQLVASYRLMTYFLAKSEPGVYSIDDLKRDGETVWDGVRNPQAVRAIQSMKPKDRVFIYHSGGESAIAGLAEVADAPQPDPK